MGILVVISPSQQTENPCKICASEANHARILGEKIINLLKQDIQFDSYLIPSVNGTESQKLVQATTLSNRYINGRSPALHICLHTDGGYDGHGCSAMCYKFGGLGEKIAREIYNRLSLFTPTSDMGISERPGLWELKATDASSCLIENSFHDQLSEAQWFHSHMDEIAQIYVDSIYAVFNLQKPQEYIDWQLAIKKVSDSSDGWISQINNMIASSQANGNLGVYEGLQFLPILIEKIANKIGWKDSWEEELKNDNVDYMTWISNINIMVSAAQANGDSGMYELLQWLPTLLMKLSKIK
jgi:hypothetical protein